MKPGAILSTLLVSSLLTLPGCVHDKETDSTFIHASRTLGPEPEFVAFRVILLNGTQEVLDATFHLREMEEWQRQGVPFGSYRAIVDAGNKSVEKNIVLNAGHWLDINYSTLTGELGVHVVEKENL